MKNNPLVLSFLQHFSTGDEKKTIKGRILLREQLSIVQTEMKWSKKSVQIPVVPFLAVFLI